MKKDPNQTELELTLGETEEGKLSSLLTARNRYSITKIGDFDSIRYPTDSRDGKSYGIIGYLNPSEMEVYMLSNSFVFAIPDPENTSRSKVIPCNDLHNYLSQEPEVGKRVVARLLDEKGNIVPEGTEYDIIMLSEIKEVIRV